MKKIIIVMTVLLSAAGLLYTQEEAVRMAVTPFDDSITAASDAEKAGLAITSALESILSKSPTLKVREAGAIRNYLDLLEKVQVGLEDPRALKRTASTLQVDYLTVGTVSRIGDSYEVDARVVDVNTWRIVHARGIRSGSGAAAGSEIGDSFVSMKSGDLREKAKASKDNPTVAVHDFRDHHGNPPGTSYGGAFMEMLTGSLGGRALVNAIESRFTRHLVEEKILEMVGVIENDGADEKFRIEGIGHRVTGDIRVFPDMICINYRLFGTAERRAIFMGNVEITGPGALRPVAGHVSKLIEDALNNRIGSLKIRTLPAGAEVRIDGAPAGAADKGDILVALEKGKHEVAAKLSGYKAFSAEVDISPRKVAEMTIRLERISDRLLRDAMILESRGKYAEAVIKYDEFIHEIGDTPEAYAAMYRKGHVILLHVKDYNSALEAFNALVGRYPDAITRAEGYFGIAMTYRAMGNIPMAKSTAKYILDYYPESYSAEAAREMLTKM